MPANEIQERHAAGFWLQARGGGGEVPANWIPGSVEIISALSIVDELILSSNPGDNPLVIVQLDRTFDRRECLITHNSVVTVDEFTRISTPVNQVNQGVPADWTGEQARVAVQPMLVAWMGAGPDYSAPDWLPFNLTYGGASPALDPSFDANLFDAIAVMFPNVFDGVPEPTTAWANNVVVNVFEVPRFEGVNPIARNQTLPFFT